MITYPLNNIDYTAEDAELYFSTRESGVYDGNDFEVTASGIDNDVTVGTGIAWIHNTKFSGKVVALKEPKTLTLSLPNSVYDRIDAIVIQFDANQNATEIVVKEGIASSSPIAPTVVRTESLYELHIFHVQRKAGATVISIDDLVDLRNDSDYCGIMFEPISSIDSTLTKSGYAADAAETGKAIKRTTNVRNLLDNSDFTNPVNQRGATTCTTEYGIDRWIIWNSVVGGKATVSANGIVLTPPSGGFTTYAQRFAKGFLDPNKTYTFAYMTTNGLVIYNEGIKFAEPFDVVEIWTDETLTVKWAALYEGEYTAETLPPYVPKGYTAEMTECRRYFRKVNTWEPFANGFVDWDSSLVALIPLDLPMRIAPSIKGTWNMTLIVCGTYIVNTATPISVVNHNYGSVEIRWAANTVASELRNQACSFRNNDGYFELSADL